MFRLVEIAHWILIYIIASTLGGGYTGDNGGDPYQHTSPVVQDQRQENK